MSKQFLLFLRYNKVSNKNLLEYYRKCYKMLNSITPTTPNYLEDSSKFKEQLLELETEIKKRKGKVIGGLASFGDKINKKYIKA